MKTKEYLLDCVRHIENNDVQEICRLIIEDREFNECVASFEKHHYYKGGLINHTAEVMQIALSMAKSKCLNVDLNILIPAVIFHDVAKIRDYSTAENGTAVETDFKKKIYHIAGSYSRWEHLAQSHRIAQSYVDAVSHCILSHHGRREWKACVEPQTLEAHILHFADMLSAGYGKNMIFGEGSF